MSPTAHAARVPPAAALLTLSLVAAVGTSPVAGTAGDAADGPTAEVVARYPSDGEMVEEPVVTPDTVANASAPQVGRTGGWQTQIQLTDDGAASFAFAAVAAVRRTT